MTLQPTYDYSNRVSANCYTHGRGGLAPTVLVAHSTCGTNDDNSVTDPVVALARSNAAANYLCNNDRQVSVQWLIGAEAAGAPIYRIVPESDTAFHAGGTPNYPSAWHDPAANNTYTGFYAPTNCSIVNAMSVGIEVFGQANDVLGPNQRKAVVLLVTDIVSRYPVMAQPGHITAHASLEGDRTDGRNWVALAGAAATNTVGANKVPTPAPPKPLPSVIDINPHGYGIGTGMKAELTKRGHIADCSEQYYGPNANQPGLMTRSMLWAHDAKGAIFVYVGYAQADFTWTVHVYSEVA